MASALTLLLAGAGCGKTPAATAPGAPVQPGKAPAVAPTPTSTQPTTPTPAPAPAAEPVVQPTSPCEHPYYPLIPGYAISYSSQSGGSRINYTMTVGGVSEESAQISFAFVNPAVTVNQELGCQAGSILAKTYLDMSSALGGADLKVETKNASGDIMPAELQVGTSWNNRFETTLTPGPKFPAKIGPMTAVIDVTNRVVGEERVTVPAGTFTALKVEVNSTQTINIPNVPAQPPQTSTGYQWWVKGVGLVKQTSGKSVTEATAISKP